MENVNYNSYLKLSSSVRYRQIDNQGVLVQLGTGRVIVVNQLGLEIVKGLASGITKENLIETVLQEYEIEHAEAASDIDRYLEMLDQEDVLEKKSADTNEPITD